MKHPMTNEHRNNELLKAIIFGIIGFMILFTIAIYGMEAKAAADNAEFQAQSEEIDRKKAAREAAREKEWAEARQELHEYFYEQKMEEARTSAEDFQTSAVILQEDFYQFVTPLAIDVLEAITEVETEEPETIMEETEDDITESQIFFEEAEISEEVQVTETEVKEVEIEMIEIEAEPEEVEVEEESVEDTMPETEKVEEVQPTQSEPEPIPTPSVVNTPVVTTTPISYQENSNVNVSLQDFLNYNGMTLEDFVIRMTCMVYPEACGESFIGKQGVAEVALNWIYSGLKTDWWDISSGFANIPVQRYYELKYSYNETDRLVIADCEQAVRSVIDGAHPVEDMLGVKPYYFLLPEKSDPINVYVMLQATYQLWVGNQLYLGMEGIDWTQKTN